MERSLSGGREIYLQTSINQLMFPGCRLVKEYDDDQIQDLEKPTDKEKQEAGTGQKCCVGVMFPTPTLSFYP